MKKKFIFKNNFVYLSVVCSVLAPLNVAVFAYFSFCSDIILEDRRTFVFVIVTCAMASALLCMLGLLFAQYLIVDEETVTFCKLFKCKQTICWKNAKLTKSTSMVKGAVVNFVVITDGTNEIRMSNINDKSFSMLEEFCSNARKSESTDNLIF